MSIIGLSAVTFAVKDMARSVAFCRGLGFDVKSGGAESSFTSLYAGSDYLNLTESANANPQGWGRAIFHVDDVDAQHRRVLATGTTPQFAPRDAPWGERYFHVTDPDGHEVSFAAPL